MPNTPPRKHPAAPRQRRSSLIFSLVLALLAVAALPFALATYQIHLARESLVDQAQQTHLIAVRASVDRISTLLSGLAATAAGAAQNPQLYTEPQSESAREVLAGILVGQGDVIAAATFFRDAQGDRLVQLARQADTGLISPEMLRAAGERAALLEVDGRKVLGLSRETSRPGLRIALIASAEGVSHALEPRELGPSAQLQLLDGDQAHALYPNPLSLPGALLDAVRAQALDALATRTETGNGVEVSSFARIPGTDWSLASLQPASEAEAAAAEMRRGAFAAMVAVVVLVALLSTLAWRAVVRPVHALLTWQRETLASDGSGGDLASLKQSFEHIQRLQRNREALNEVFLGRYKLLSTLGQGAMGSVFLAWDPRLKRHVAIKTIHLDALDPKMQASLAKTLENEAVAVASLRHANIVSVFDLEAAGQFAFVVMEYVEGGNLRTLISRNGALTAPEVCFIAQSLLKALDAAHQAGLLHLDIKPGNVLVPPQGEIMLTDFGVSAWRFEVADLIARGGLAGTPGFIAPEYVNGAAPTERSDLFSLGVLLAECISGNAQHIPGAKTGDLRRAAYRAIKLPDFALKNAPELCAAILRLCALDPAARPASAAVALTLFEQLPTAGGLRQLGARALELSQEASTGPAAITSATTRRGEDAAAATRPAPGDASTRPPPGVSGSDHTPRVDTARTARQDAATLPPPGSNDDSTRPPLSVSPSAQDAMTRAPPQRDDDATRPPPAATAGPLQITPITSANADADEDATRPPPEKR